MIRNNLYSGEGKLVLMSFAHPVEHVPPPINSAKVLSDHGYRVILLDIRSQVNQCLRE